MELGESGTSLAEGPGRFCVPIGFVGIELQEVICVLVNDGAKRPIGELFHL